MANITGHESGLVVKSIKEIAPKKRKTKVKPMVGVPVCGCCGYTFDGSAYQIKRRFYAEYVGDSTNYYCLACTNFFGLAGGGIMNSGYTDLGYDSTVKRLEDAEELGYAVILRTMNFSGATSGISFNVDFGDIFKIKRIGTNDEPSGTKEDVFRRYTIDIEVGVDTLTLYPHEYGTISWVEIMLSRKEGAYREAFLCAEDKSGYFKPTESCRKELQATFGER